MSSETVEAFPLQWPAGSQRAKERKYSSFQCTVAQARDGINKQIGLLKGINLIISSNVPVRANGDMYATMKPVDGDTGVAVYFTWKGEQYVVACDAYVYLWENLRAIEKSIEAMRGLERWGASDILRQAFMGFKALPASAPVKRDWWDVLGVEKKSYPNEVKSAYRWLLQKYHPDKPGTGDAELFNEVQAAYAKYQKI